MLKKVCARQFKKNALLGGRAGARYALQSVMRRARGLLQLSYFCVLLDPACLFGLPLDPACLFGFTKTMSACSHLSFWNVTRRTDVIDRFPLN